MGLRGTVAAVICGRRLRPATPAHSRVWAAVEVKPAASASGVPRAALPRGVLGEAAARERQAAVAVVLAGPVAVVAVAAAVVAAAEGGGDEDRSDSYGNWTDIERGA